MVHGSYRDLVEEKNNLENEQLFKAINKQRNKEQVLGLVREKELNFTHLAIDNKAEVLSMWSQKDAEYRKLEALESIAEDMRKLLTDTRLRYVRRGQVYGNRFTILPGALYQIDIVNPEHSNNPPPGLFIRTPRRPVPTVKFVNEGATPGLLLIDTNQDYSTNTQPTLAIPSPANANVAPIQYVLDTGEPVVERINFMVTGISSPTTITIQINFEI